MTKFKLLLLVASLVGFAAIAYAGFDDGKAAMTAAMGDKPPAACITL